MITGGFKNMNADQIIKCILAAMLKLEKSAGGIVEDRIVDGVADKAPSQNAVHDAIKLLMASDIANDSSIPGSTIKEALNNLLSIAGLTEQLDFEANGVDNFVDIQTTSKPKLFFYGSVLQLRESWVQNGSIITFNFIPESGAGYKNLTFI